jgi:hypothetical protein
MTKCDNCGIDVEYDRAHSVNGFAWCKPCQKAEEERHQREDTTGSRSSVFLPPGKKQMVFSRPPKYVLPKAAWKEFGYDENSDSAD